MPRHDSSEMPPQAADAPAGGADFSRRQALAGAIVGAALWSREACGELSPAASTALDGRRPTALVDGHEVRLISPELPGDGAPSRTARVCVIADTHLFRDDPRGDAWRTYSDRMARAYNQTQHWQTGEPTTPEECFVAALQDARQWQADLVVLAGDILSFPSEAAVEWTLAQLAEAGLPYVYTAGNHDWHYEGLPGTLDELRAEWCDRRLRPLYQGADPLMAVHDVGGLRIVTIDNSTYEITPAQLEFFRAELALGRPTLLVCHIPLYFPGRPMGFGCGHPSWGAAADRNYELERRPKWPDGGHTTTTLAFHREAFAATNLWGVCAGHTHRASTSVAQGLPQVVASPNLSGGYLKLTFALA